MKKPFVLASLLLLLTGTRVPASGAQAHHYLIVWAMETKVYPGDGTGHDFLSVFDMDRGPEFAKLIAMLPVATRSQMAHHANYAMPANGQIFANDFMDARTYVFDVRNPVQPRVAATFTDAGPYSHPHSFETLPDGHVLAAYQQRGNGDVQAGALVELDSNGKMLRATSAADAAVEPFIRPYSLLVLSKIDRVVTTSTDMMPTGMMPSHVVQVWRLSDLTLLKTVLLPPEQHLPTANVDADEARALADGTVIVKTASCTLYRLNAVAGTNPSAQFIYDFGYRSCGSVPVVAGNYWIEAVFRGHSIVSLDMSDPAHPVQVSQLYLGPKAVPHWLSLDPESNTLVITGFGSLLNTIAFANVNPRTGAITAQPHTLSFIRNWPDGWHGPAIPHAALFYTR